jgi:hypothetical protein
MVEVVQMFLHLCIPCKRVQRDKVSAAAVVLVDCPARCVLVCLIKCYNTNVTSPPTPTLQVGISLNYNKVYGWIDFDQISPEYISKNFDREWKAQARKFPMDLPNMKRLYQAVDVIGVSGVLF